MKVIGRLRKYCCRHNNRINVNYLKTTEVRLDLNGNKFESDPNCFMPLMSLALMLSSQALFNINWTTSP